jgi:hypothetical protein
MLSERIENPLPFFGRITKIAAPTPLLVGDRIVIVRGSPSARGFQIDVPCLLPQCSRTSSIRLPLGPNISPAASSVTRSTAQ